MKADKQMVLKYQSGEEIRSGDLVLFHREEAKVEFVACDPDDSATSWYVQKFGGGVMIDDPKVSGRTFIPASLLADDETLEFICRAGGSLRTPQ
jgi:hypothetical protein